MTGIRVKPWWPAVGRGAMRAMKVVTRGTIASAVHRNSQDIDVLNGVVDKLCLGIFGCSWRVGSWEQGDEEVLKLKSKRSGSRSKTAPAIARGSRILARQAAAAFWSRGQCFTTTTTATQWAMASAVLKGAEISMHRFGDGTISKMPHILLNTYLAQPLLPRLVPPSSHVPSPLKPDLSRLKTHTPHVIAVLLLWDNILYANPDPFPCLSYPSPSIAPPVAPGAGSGRPVPNEK